MKFLQLLRTVFSRFRLNVVVGLVILIAVWFGLPHIQIGNSYPFASTGARVLVTLIIGLIYSSKYIIAFVQTHRAKSFAVISDKCKLVWRGLVRGSKASWSYTKYMAVETKDRIKNDKRKRRLRKLPWYLVLGASQAGKKSVIKNTGLTFARPEHFGEEAVNYINQFPDYEWWFSENAVLIDPMTYDNETDVNSWRRFIKLLRRERKNKPLSGVILTFSIVDLMQYSNQARQEFLQTISHYIRDVYGSFKSLVPVYITFTKCDLVEGFLEFFNDMSKEELRQVWGMTMPLENCNDPQAVQKFFQDKYQALVKQLEKRVMWSMSLEKSPRGRELIHAFPQQMQLLERPIQYFLTELFGAVRYHKALQVRGVYFTSCNQQSGEAQDFVVQALSKKYQFTPPRFERPSRLGECYFMHSLFYNVILPESQFLGDSERAKRIRRTAYNSFLVACPAVVLLTASSMYAGYRENKANLKLVDQNIAYYNSAVANIKPNDDSLTTVLPALNQLNEARNLYTKSSDIGLDFLFETGSIEDSINSALQRSLHSLFLPRVAAQIESSLNQNIPDQNLLYATLKGYLTFSATDYTNDNAVTVPMEQMWNSQFLKYPGTKDNLRYYLNLALQKSVEKLPLDESLISRIRGELERIIPSQRAYGLLTLRSSVSNLPNLIVTTAVGSNFDDIFSITNKHDVIPALYTRAGYNKVFLPNYADIAEEVARDNHDIGLRNDSDETQTADQINMIMQQTYNVRYTKAWQSALDSVHVKKFTSLDQAIASLNLLISKNSPLAKLLDITYDNTSPVTHDKVQVTSHFAPINEFIRGEGSGASWSMIVKDLTKVRDYLVTLQQASNRNLVAFNAAKAAMQGTQSPIQTLSFDARKTAQPVQCWLNSIADNCWDIVASGARAEMDDAWKNMVVGVYNQNIRGRYPLVKNADSQVAIKDFNTFFGNNGELQRYFDQYIKPFLNTDKPQWVEYNVNGHSIGLPKSSIELFERAKTIRDQFFPHGAKSTSFSFTVKPLTLTSKASSILFAIGGNNLDYSHGPQRVTPVSWPMPFNNENASIIINGFNSDQYSRAASGPWSLYRMFDYGVLKPTGDNGTYLFDVNFSGYTASYEITGADNINIFRLTALKGLQLPAVVAPNAAVTENQS